jgi:hypothetical protein
MANRTALAGVRALGDGTVEATWMQAVETDAGWRFFGNPHILLIPPTVEVANAVAAMNADITARPGLLWAAADLADVELLREACAPYQTAQAQAAYRASIAEAEARAKV